MTNIGHIGLLHAFDWRLKNGNELVYVGLGKTKSGGLVMVEAGSVCL